MECRWPAFAVLSTPLRHYPYLESWRKKGVWSRKCSSRIRRFGFPLKCVFNGCLGQNIVCIVLLILNAAARQLEFVYPVELANSEACSVDGSWLVPILKQPEQCRSLHSLFSSWQEVKHESTSCPSKVTQAKVRGRKHFETFCHCSHSSLWKMYKMFWNINLSPVCRILNFPFPSTPTPRQPW